MKRMDGYAKLQIIAVISFFALVFSPRAILAQKRVQVSDSTNSDFIQRKDDIWGPVIYKQGRSQRFGWGSDIGKLFSGSEKAQSHAHTAKGLWIAGRAISIVGIVGMVGSLIAVSIKPDLMTSYDGSGQPDGIAYPGATMLASGVLVTLTGLLLEASSYIALSKGIYHYNKSLIQKRRATKIKVTYKRVSFYYRGSE